MKICSFDFREYEAKRYQMKANFVLTVVLLEMIFVAGVSAVDCSVSKEFHIKHPQVLAGVLQDPNSATLPGIGLQLLSGVNRYSASPDEQSGGIRFWYGICWEVSTSGSVW